MEQSRSRFLQLAGGAAAGLATAGRASGATSKPKAKVESDADVSALYAAAKKEGTVVWWTAHYAQSAADRMRDAFKAKYPGIEVQLLRQTAQVIYQRLNQDLKSNVHEVDVFCSTDEAHHAELKKQGVLAEFVPADINKVPPLLRHLDPDNTYQIGAIGFVLLNYNTKIQPPHRWPQLGDPRLRGQVTLGHPAFSGYVGNWVIAMNDKYGWEYFKNLAQNNPKIGRSVNDTVADIVSGERMAGAGPDNFSLEKKAGGNPIDIIYPDDDAIIITGPASVMKDAPHPNAARLFQNFMYSREYSESLVKTFNYPIRTDVPSANGRTLSSIRWTRNTVARLTSGIPEVVAKWRETFGV
ncbi:MAG: extracellular solute-binding protein [Candidatus Eremiobacteraeota bacterium]|nr:extracellular solute-binding protein [Candidatus Eremiobacteraeota bacterium]